MKTADLIVQIRSGSQSAFGILLSEYKPLLHGEVSRFCQNPGSEDAEDFTQVAMLALYRAALNFDLDQHDVEFGLYAKICISNALSSQLRAKRRHIAEVPIPETFSVDCREDPAGRIMEEEAVALLHAKIRSVLSPYENRVWSLYIAGYRSGEVARLLGKDPHSIENAVYRIRRKLRKELRDQV